MAIESNISIFTLNCWGIPVISCDRASRIHAISEILALGQYDLVCLQEVWSKKDYGQIRQHVAKVLPYAHYFYSGVLGSGLCVFSKYPIYDVFFHQWSVNGHVHKVQHGDWFGGKGVGLCKLMINDLNVNLYTAHLHAEYNRDDDEYLAHRVLQAFDTAQFIRLTSEHADLVILGGDLNTEPYALSKRMISYNAQLEDAFEHSDPVPSDCVGTNESCRNSYCSGAARKAHSRGKRIDYIMYKAGQRIIVKEVSYKLPLPCRVPGRNFSYSDHEAIAASILLSSSRTNVALTLDHHQNHEETVMVLQEGLKVCTQALAKLRRDHRYYWMMSAFLFMILLTLLSSNAPYYSHRIHKFIVSIITSMMCFTILMGSLWNRMEVNGILAGKLAMELRHSNLRIGTQIASPVNDNTDQPPNAHAQIQY